MLVKDIEPCKYKQSHKSASIFTEEDYFTVKEKESLKLIVDAPCLAACSYLYDLNIRVVSNSCNKNDIDHAYITIDYGSLSEENIEVFESLVSVGTIENVLLQDNQHGYIGFNIIVPLNNLSTVEDVSKSFCLITKMFKPQDVLYGRVPKKAMKDMVFSNLKEAKKNIVNKGNDLFLDIFDYVTSLAEEENSDIETLIIDKVLRTVRNWENYYYDEEEDVYWICKSLYERHKNYQNNSKEDKDKNI